MDDKVDSKTQAQSIYVRRSSGGATISIVEKKRSFNNRSFHVFKECIPELIEMLKKVNDEFEDEK